jgi:hypothetical protein
MSKFLSDCSQQPAATGASPASTFLTLLISDQRSPMLMLDDFPGAVPPLAMRPDPAFEEKSERSYELNEISINSPLRGV